MFTEEAAYCIALLYGIYVGLPLWMLIVFGFGFGIQLVTNALKEFNK